MPYSSTATPWHQDAAFANLWGWRRLGLHFWIPLQDTTVENGCMNFVPGSHWSTVFQHRRFQQRSGKTGLEITRLGSSEDVCCPVKLGGFTVHTPRTLHSAGPNKTSSTRKVWVIQFVKFGELRLKLKQLLRRAPSVSITTDRDSCHYSQ